MVGFASQRSRRDALDSFPRPLHAALLLLVARAGQSAGSQLLLPHAHVDAGQGSLWVSKL
eukprot:10946995-Prorocentrum_lima.AAC.1